MTGGNTQARIRRTRRRSAQERLACGWRVTQAISEDREKPYIGDDVRSVGISDIRRANRLLYVTAFLCEAILLVLLIVVCAVIAGRW